MADPLNEDDRKIAILLARDLLVASQTGRPTYSTPQFRATDVQNAFALATAFVRVGIDFKKYGY